MSAGGPSSSTAEPRLPEWIEVGAIKAPHGVYGEMKVVPLTDFPAERLGEPGPRWLQARAPKVGRNRQAPPAEVQLEYGRSMISKVSQDCV